MKSCKGNGGFTLIEILVATTILLVIVILASLVFQQTTGAYDTGERKVNANVILRNVVGAISRDLALAVDSDEYDGLANNKWNGSSISFVAMTGRPGYDAEGEEDPDCRTPHVISYSSDGTRTDVATSFDNGKWKEKGPKVSSKLYDTSSLDGASVRVEFFPDDTSPLPENVYIRAELETEGSTSAVGAGSGGRRGWGSADEIWVGLRP